MKRLFLVRHAKSDWSEPALSDFERPLNARGLRDAPFMAAKLAERMDDALTIVSSPANRAISTARYFAKALKINEKDIRLEKNIYEAAYTQLLDIVNGMDEKFSTVILVGHNPGFSLLSTYLSGKLIDLPTCGIAEIVFELESWKLVSGSSGILKKFDYPKKFT